MPSTIGLRVRMFRENLGINQHEASLRAGVSQLSWSSIEGDLKTPSAGEALGISRALGVTIGTITGMSAIRERVVAQVPALEIDEADLEPIREEMLSLLESAAELVDKGYLDRRPNQHS
ncbi:helix-turn-helix transcriptional regulator [Agromyces sp. NPDC057679]|uniref:helix-turn-helix transcriptional regulator n=1 Tax=Agromyces sp. NPDC057679 TaxID=3346207 RepID=UPI00366EEDDB